MEAVPHCDNKSVGIIIENQDGDILLLDRARYPFGLAPPAGHVDGHGSPEQTAVDETYEESGLIVSTSDLVKLISDRRLSNTCRRPGGDHHDWTVFLARNFSGTLRANHKETLGAQWYSRKRLGELACATRLRTTEPQRGDAVLEQIWLDMFVELGFVD